MARISRSSAPTGIDTVTTSPTFLPRMAWPTGDSLESRAFVGIRLGRADQGVYADVAGLLVTEGDGAADADLVGVDLGVLDDPSAAQLLLQQPDAVLEQGLLVLGVVVLGVLADVAELARLTDALGYLFALDGRRGR